ncbi:acyltransferase family protein [Marinospirillum sp.]|uniref:acyltransferase family protein n=1 Tax=Marinospirillum sp. TaxID=2183934 RepID=UPI00384C3A49
MKPANFRELLFQPVIQVQSGQRIPAIDLARGLAVSLMILSHGVVGLLPYEDFTDYGQIPIHLITKFSSTLFIIIFGMALAVAFLPKVGTEDWPRLRTKLLINAVVVFFWYKILTIAELLYLAGPESIKEHLLYQDFPSFVEILGFYALALLWVPFVLPLWAKTPLWARLLTPLLLILLNIWVGQHFNFWGIGQIEALFVEHEDYYTWGQLARSPLIFLGLLLGELLLVCYAKPGRRLLLFAFLLLASAISFGLLFLFSFPDWLKALEQIAANQGKHPPEMLFMLFSLGGALALLALSILGGGLLAKLFLPITVIGSNALQAFIFHILVIFIGFRYLLGYWHNVSYEFALTFTLCLLPATALWIKVISWIKAHR